MRMLALAAEDKELRLNAETRKQNEILDQIQSGMEDILQNAKVHLLLCSELVVTAQTNCLLCLCRLWGTA